MLVPRAVCLTIVAVALTLLGATPAAAGPPRGPATVAVLGDSAASGEGAGAYEPGTRGEDGNWCHRSTRAYAQRLAAGPGVRAVNLACSGARAADVAFGGRHYGEGSQAERLGALARTARVTAVVLQVGGNDDPALIPTGIACIRAFVDPVVPGCRETVGPQWAGRLAAMSPKVAAALTDVRAALRGAGYGDRDYTLVLASYASPVTEDMSGVPAAAGCPYSRADAAWGRTVAIPQLSAALRGVAARAGVRFLALDRATEGREACARGGVEWQRRITVDPEALVRGDLPEGVRHLFQESFHPSAAGHAELGRCVGEFLRADPATAVEAACRVGDDGHLHTAPLPAATPDAAAA